MKKFLLIILFIPLFAYQEVYFMPNEGKKAEQKLFYLFTHAKKNIKIVIYTFTNKKLSKALKIASKKGVKITIIADKKESLYNRSVIPNLATIRNVKIYLLSGKSYKNGEKAKMHVKMSIVDDNKLIIGSANYSYSAFYKNYEYLLISDDRYLTTQFKSFFHHLLTISTPYKLAFLK